jgi:hypothetical protein
MKRGIGPLCGVMRFDKSCHLVDVAPTPSFGRAVSLNKRVAGDVKVLCGVAIGRIITESDVAVRAAETQMDPDIIALQTFLATSALGITSRITFR